MAVIETEMECPDCGGVHPVRIVTTENGELADIEYPGLAE